MNKQFFFRLLLLISILSLAVGCRKKESELPTPAPTTIPPTSIPTTELPTETPLLPISADWAPQLIYASPAPQEELPLNGVVTFRFDQPMEPDSVQSAFELTNLETGAIIDGTFSWPRPDTLLFTPQNLTAASQYSLKLKETARGKNGKNLIESIQMILETMGPLQISQISPADRATEIDTDGSITLLFNRPVVPLVSTSQQKELPHPLTLTPATEGTGEWVSTSIYRFTPNKPLDGATRYQIDVNNQFTDYAGNQLENPFTSHFSTVSPSLVSIFPTDGSTQIRLNQTFTATFNMPMDHQSTERAIFFSPFMSFDFNWSEDSRSVGITPKEKLNLGTDYTITFSTDAQSANKSASLDRETRINFTTIPYPSVLNTSPSNRETNVYYQQGIQIYFASHMDLATIEDQLIIEPAPEKIVYYLNPYDTALYLFFDLERNSTYNITIPKTAADPYGNEIGQEYSFSFTTRGFDPLASFNLPNNISYLSNNRPTEIDILYRNLSELNVNLYQLDLPLDLITEPYRVYDYNPIAAPRRSWQIPTSADQDESKAVRLDLTNEELASLPNGVYFLSLSSPQLNKNSVYWQNQRNILVVADTNIVVKEMDGRSYFWVTDLATGKPVPNRTLTVYDRYGNYLGPTISDNNGFANFQRVDGNSYLDGLWVVSGTSNNPGFGIGSSQWNDGITPWQFDIPATSSKQSDLSTYMYTDRPIYRPGDTVQFRGFIRQNQHGRYSLADLSTLTLELQNYNGVNNDTPPKFQLELDDNGGFSGSYDIPLDSDLGTFNFYIQPDRKTNWSIDNNGLSFTVAQYRRPEFIVKFDNPTSEQLRGEEVTVFVDASYFFGGPASDLRVEWNAVTQPNYYPFPFDSYQFNPATKADDTLFNPFFFGNNELLSGSGKTDNNGRFAITLPANLLETTEEGPVKIQIEARILDLGNNPVSTRTELTFHPATTYVGLQAENYIGTADKLTLVNLQTVNWAKEAEPNRPVSIEIFRREWEYNRKQQFGSYQTIWEPIDTLIDTDQLVTDTEGKGTTAFIPTDGGIYVVQATVTDPTGHTQTSELTLWVSDSDYIAWRTDPKEKRMTLIADKASYQPGDTAKILVQSPFVGPVQAWLTIERGALIEQKLINLNSSSDQISIPINAEFAPNVIVSIATVKGVDETNQYADIRMGMINLSVDPAQLLLNLSLTPRQTTFQPQETAVYDIRVTDYAGNPVAADLSLSLVDLAVLTLKSDNATPIDDLLYAEQPMRSQTGASLIISAEGIPLEVPVEQWGGGGGGGGGMASDESLALAPTDAQRKSGNSAETNVRQDFRDTAFWQAKIRTNTNGEATIEIPLPDNLTTWRLSSKAVSLKGTLVGQSSTDVVVNLPLLIRPVTPRFLVVNDQINLAAIVHNNSDEPLTADVWLEATGVMLAQEKTTITLPPRSNQLVQWAATVQDTNFVDLTFYADSGTHADATKPTFGNSPDHLIPVYRYTGEDIVGTSGTLTGPGKQVEAILLPPGIDHGSVQINLNASLAGALTSSLEAINRQPYDRACAHQINNRTLPNIVTYRSFDRLNITNTTKDELENLIKVDLADMTSQQKLDGGWSWCYSENSDPYLTAYIFFGLDQAEKAGFSVPDDIMRAAERYIRLQLKPTNQLNETDEIDQQIFYLYLLAERKAASAADLSEIFTDHRNLISPQGKALLALAFYLDGNDAKAVESLLADLNDSVILSATGAHWENSQGRGNYFGSDIETTAVVLNTLTQLQPDSPLTPNGVRWLMRARTANSWSTGQQTSWSILALTEWMIATDELNADYSYGVQLNNSPISTGFYNQDNILTNKALSISVQEMSKDDLNFLVFEHGAGDGQLYYTAHLDAHINADQISAVARGFHINRNYYDAACDIDCEPISSAPAGTEIRVELTIILPHNHQFVIIKDPIPSGAEAVDPNLESSSLSNQTRSYRPGYWGWWYFNHIEYRDDHVLFNTQYLPAGTYQYSYTLNTLIPGSYQVMPTTAREEFFPEQFGRSDGLIFTITEPTYE